MTSTVTLKRQVLSAVREAFDREKWLIRGEVPAFEFVKECVENVSTKYSIDPDRVFLHSHSDGGNFAFHLAFKHRDLVRGVAAVAAPLRSRPLENNPEYRLQFHLVCGDQDRLWAAVKKTAAGLRRMKYPVSLRKVFGHGHRYPPSRDVREIGRWADCLDRI